MRVLLTSLALALLLAGCATAPRCGPGELAGVNDLLYFGTDRAGGPVTPDEWAGFLRSAVTPRFPDGFTAWPATGQWREGDGRIVQEASFVLSVVHPDDAAIDRSVLAVIHDYKTRFRQKSVLRVRSAACYSF